MYSDDLETMLQVYPVEIFYSIFNVHYFSGFNNTSHGKHNWRNISGHALMGRPAARLETMVLVINSYVLV